MLTRATLLFAFFDLGFAGYLLPEGNGIAVLRCVSDVILAKDTPNGCYEYAMLGQVDVQEAEFINKNLMNRMKTRQLYDG